MDLTKVTDVKELKAMAYDQLVAKDVAERNLIAINQRLDQLAAEKEKPSGESRRS